MKRAIVLAIFATMAQHALASDQCGDIDDGIQRAQDLAGWQPEKLVGDQIIWYYNSTARVQASMLTAKLNSGNLTPAEKAQLETQIQKICASID